MAPPETPRRNVWETDIYATGKQINRWPHTEIVSRVLRATAEADRGSIRILELGCGTGNNLRFLAEEGFQAFGIDVSPTAIAKAGDLLSTNGLYGTLHTGDFYALPWMNQHFDLVIDRAALVHNTPNRIQQILGEAGRVLKPSGRIISVGLKGTRHPDLQFGRQSENGAWCDFTQGKFQGLTETSFFQAVEVEGLFRNFDIQSAERMTRRTLAGEMLDDEFIVEAIKR
jgi:SAM-dependent methyltransferase